VTLRENHAGDPVLLAEARFALAQALWGAGRDRPRALRLADATRSVYEAAGARGHDKLVTVDEWLARHRR
jgi:hypothetical protein